MAMVPKIKKLLLVIFVSLMTLNSYSQNRVDSVSSNYADMNGGATVKTILIGFDKCSGLSYSYNSVKLYHYLSLGNDYKYGTATNSATVTLKIDVYSTTSGTSGLMQTFTGNVLAVNQDAPEKEYIQDITNLVKTGAVRAVITTSAFSCSVPYQSRIRLASFYKEDVGVDVRGKTVTPLTLTVKNPVKFAWSRIGNQQCIPNYQIQVLRLFNRDIAKSGNELQLNDVIDWSRAVSIETNNPDTTFQLTLAEGRGYYTWRVRPIGTAFPGGAANWRNYGNWNSTSLADGATVNFTTNPYASSILFFYYQFDDNKNWIYSRTFSEGDPMNTKTRISETATYANGLQQVKQQQVKQQSTNRIVANQTIYDFSGRPALITLPAPIDSVPPARGDTLGYFNGFMKVGSTLYTAQHFDNFATSANPTAATAGPIIDYYSNTNSDKFVANAEGYPYSRNIYTKDGTGRIKEIGIPGETGRIKSASDHTAKTVTTGVSDQELIRVFGDEAPEAKSVYKTINIDANKTASIAYTSKEGQTIATALSIVSDSTGAALDTLPGYKTARINIKDTIWGNSPFGKFGITSNKPMAFAVPTAVAFKYTIKKKDITQMCMNYCTTCDYTIQFLLHTDDTSLVIGNKLLPASTCTTPPAKWDTTFTKLLDAGKKYTIEKRVFANNVKPGSNPTRTYLDISIDSVRNTLERTANDSLKIIYGYLKRNSMDSLYRYLNNGVFLNFSGNADSLYANSTFTKKIGCTTIKIPVTFCKKETCPADFEKYFNDRWKGTIYADDPGTAYLDYFAPPYGQTTYRFQKGQFNYLVKNMLNDGYDCQKLWTCWKRVVQNYKGMKQMADTTTTGYKFDLMEEFLRCTGRKFAGYSDTDTSKFLGKAYKYFYRVSPTTTCDNAMTAVYGTLTGWSQDSLVVINPLSKKWENYYNCIRSLTTVDANEPTPKKNTAEGGCQAACNARYGAFKQSIINMYHNDSVYIEGDKYKLKKDTTWGQVYSFHTDTLVSAPTAAYYRSMASVECMAHTLVESCISNCTLTVYDTLSGSKKFGTAAQLDAMKKAMTWNFELKRGDKSTASCGNGWKKLGPGSGFDAASDSIISVLWQKNYGGVYIDYLTSIIKLKFSNGTLLTGSKYLGNMTNAEYYVIKINDKGDVMWERTFGGSNDDFIINSIETSDGGFLLGGNSLSGISGNKSEASRGYRDYWLVKLDAFGNIIWEKTYGGNYDDILSSLMETKDGNFIIAGSSISGQSGDKTEDIRGGNGFDYWVLKINKNGQKIWDKRFGSTGNDYVRNLKEAHDGNYVLAGYSHNTGGTPTDRSQPAFGTDFWDSDYWIVKIDKNGNKIWDKAYGGTNEEIDTDIFQLESGDYLVAGLSKSNISGNKSINSYANSLDIWMLKINDRDWISNGDTIRWQAVYGGNADEYGRQSYDDKRTVKIIPSANNKEFYILISSLSNISGNKSQNSFNNTMDYWLVKVDDSGQKIWDRRWGGTANDAFIDMARDKEGNLWLGGYSYSSTSGNKTVGTNGDFDIWILKTRETCTHDSVCFRWVDTPTQYVGDSTTFEFKYLSCDSVNSNYVYNTIMLQVQQYVDSALTDYRSQYLLTCANPDNIKDTLSLSYAQGYYQYTLYYYDRAGNLVRTVPPNGVNYKDGSNVLVTNRSQHNAHTFVTKYWYNSIKQLVRQESPDGGISNFWYDYKGQLRMSQNAKQKAANKYSYTKYDNLGRIIEVGESSDSISTFNKTWNLNSSTFPVNNNKERTYTVYTTQAANVYYVDGRSPRYLQNRVSYTYTDDKVYTYYSYDPHGNVEWLVQDLPELGKSFIRYEYDLISNKVLAVHYNETGADEFHHRYSYDTDQRILTAQTSWGNGSISSSSSMQPQPAAVKQNSVGWDTDARYKYFIHGPLKRTEVGEDHIQGMDYVYTINGWIKGINYPTLAAADDPGGDNNKTFAADAFGMVLGYHDNDFNRASSKFNPSNANLVSSTTTSSGQPGVNLYNGNISTWTLQTGVPSVNTSGLMGFKYKYDQLNRIKTEDFRSYVTSIWTDPSTTYDNKFTYDGNGNILTLNRKGNGSEMDDLVYSYTSGTNELDHVDDNGAYTSLYATDIDDQNTANYTYDPIGNLTADVQAGISNINWNVYGKIKSIRKTNGDSIIFTYDASGSRIMKNVKPASGTPTITYYVKDATSNPLSVYQRTTNGSVYEYRQKEATIFGSSRLGLKRTDILMKTLKTDGSDLNCFSCAKYFWTIDVQHANGFFARDINKKTYELNDHLGNVRVTVSDRKNTDSTVALVSYANFYAFGSEMPGKTYSTNSYRYGFNGKEKDDEVKGSGNQQDYGMRIYDPRLGRFLSVDPLTNKFAFNSPYCFAQNDVIRAIDLDGLETVVIIGGADLFNTGKPTETMLGIRKDVQAYAEANKIDLKIHSVVVPRGDTNPFTKIGEKSSYQAAKDYVKANYKQGEPIVIYGYSYGGAIAQGVANDLAKEGYKVNLLITVDGNTGSGENYGTKGVIEKGVDLNVNYYQNVGNLIGSYGVENKPASDNKTSTIINVDKTNETPNQPGAVPSWAPDAVQEMNKHGNIDELTQKESTTLIKGAITPKHADPQPPPPTGNN